MRLVVGSVSFLALLSLIACSGRPSESAARSQFSKKVQGESKGIVKVISFQKTNGFGSTFFGSPAYAVKYRSEVEFTQDCLWLHLFPPRREDFFVDVTQHDPELHDEYREFCRKGARKLITGTLLFRETENGWEYVSLGEPGD